MSNLTYTDVPIDLIVNKLSKEKYDSLVNANLINDTEIYLVDEDNLDAASGVISNVGTPVSPTDAANKSYVDTVSSNIVTAFPEIPDNIVINNAGNNTSNLAIGTYAQATGYNSIATGSDAQATSEGSIAIGGCHAQATSEGSIATGFGAKATGYTSIATGYYAQATGSRSIATGYFVKAQDDYTIAIGASKGNNYSVSASTAVPIVIGSDASTVSAAQIRVTKEGVMTVGGKEVGASLFETKTFTTDSQEGETDLMVIAKQENGVQPRLHAGDKDIHGVTGFSNESANYTGQRYLLDWDLAMSNDTSYLMGATKWTGSRRIGADNDAYTTTFVQPLIPANTGTTNQVLPYALPCFENSPVYWNGHIIWNNSLCTDKNCSSYYGKYTAQAKDITIPWHNAGTDVASIEFVVNNNKTDPACLHRSLAIGYCAKANFCHSVAIGPFTDATGCDAIAVGHTAEATGYYSIATGYGTNATGDFSIATGPYTQARCHSAIAIGYNASATGSSSIAIGCHAKAQNDYTISIGASKGNNYSVSASTAVPIVIGSDYSSVSAAQITVTSAGILKVGGNPVAMQDDIPDNIVTNNAGNNTTNLAIGTGALADGVGSIATGLDAYACANSIATGLGAQATAFSSIATGFYANATGANSIATGTYVYAQDDYTIAIGASKNDNYSVSASTAVPIVIGSNASSVSAAQITVTSAGILNVGGVEMAKKSDALITIKRWDD